MTATQNSNSAARSALPFLQGVLPFDKARFGPDLVAGITLAALGIPVAMGYTKIIGTPVITGLYTLFLPVLVFAFFGSSRHLVVSADSATAAMVAAALTSLSFAPNTARYTELTSLIGMVAASLLLLARVFRLGFLADFLSRTVLVGFLSGVGVQIAVGELHAMLGIEKRGHGFLGQLLYTFEHLRDARLPSLFIALTVLAIIVSFEMVAPRFPGALLAVIGMTGASAYFHWADRGVQVVGFVPSGLPHLGLPHFSYADILMVLPISFSCLVVILAQSAATARAYALKYRDQFDQNVDLIGLCLANAAAGCSGTFVVNGSPTQSAVVDTAGGRSQVSQITTATVVLLVLLFFTGPLSFLPNAVLAAIVFLIGVKLIDHRGLKQILRAKPNEFALALATAATVVVLGVEQGIILAIALSLFEHVRHHRQRREGVGPADIERQMRDHFGDLHPREAVIHRPVEVIGNLRNLTGSDQRADGDEAALARRELRAQPQIPEQEVRGVAHDARHGRAELLLDARGPLRLSRLVQGQARG